MSQQEMENRLAALEKAVVELQQRVSANGNSEMDPKDQSPWWITQAGKYQGDADFAAAMRLGKKYRDSQNPYKKKTRKKQTKKPV